MRKTPRIDIPVTQEQMEHLLRLAASQQSTTGKFCSVSKIVRQLIDHSRNEFVMNGGK